MAVVPPLVVHPHALLGDGRVTVVDAFRERETLGAYIKRTGAVVPRGPVAVWHNGHRVPDALWRKLIPRTGDQVIIRARLIGGGGDGNKVLRTVAMVALVVASITIPGAGIAGLYSGFGLTGTSLALASAAIMIGGSLLINALLPPPKPTAAQLGTGAKYESSPTYAISGGRNRARMWEPMSVIFGKHKVVADYGAKYWTEYVGDDQYLNQVFHFGLQAGGVELSEFKIGDTPITNYQGVQIQVSGPDGKLSMFPGNVDTLQGFVVNNSDGWIQRTTPVDTTSISVEFAASLFAINDDGSMSGRTAEFRVQQRAVGATDWIDVGWKDAVYATHYWSFRVNGQQLKYDASLSPSAHYEGQVDTAYETVEYSDLFKLVSFSESYTRLVYGTWHWVPHPNALGQPWLRRAPDPFISGVVPSVSMYGARQEATRKTLSWNVPAGQYEVRVIKLTGDIKSSRESNESAISQILCYQTDTADYTGQVRVAVRIKATGQLNGAVDELSAIAKASCIVFDGTDWNVAHTRNPAWWFLHFAYGRLTESGGRVYGGGLDGDQVDLESIKAWALWCESKDLTFDYVLDRKSSVAEVLQMIARAGRASPTWQTGKLGVVWDMADLPVTAMFGPFNIKAGSFKVDYISEGNVDEVVLNFVNEDKNYEMDEVRVAVPGATTSTNPIQLDLDGCTRASMAGRDANLIAASQVWHRRRTSWETDIEGWIAGRGDVVQISHDLMVWGYSGRLLSRDGNTITLSQHVPSGGSGTLLLRGPENQMKTVSVTSAAGDVDVLMITSDMTGFPLPGDAGYEDIPEVDWAWFFDPLETPGRRFKITDVDPTEDGVRFSAVDDDPGYYASENDPYAYVPPRDGSYLAGVVFGIQATESIVNVAADISNVSFSWALSRAMPVQVAVSINGIARPVVDTSDRSIVVQAQTGDVLTVTVTPKSERGAGTPSTLTYTVLGLTAPLPAVTGLANVFRDGLTVLIWNRVVDIRQPDYEVRLGESWANSRTVAIVPTLETLAVGNGLYWVAARFATRGTVVYGPADSLQISGATLTRNVLVTEVESPAWLGAKTGGTYVLDDELSLIGAGDILTAPDFLSITDVLRFGGAVQSGTYEGTETIDIGYVAPVRIDFAIEAYGLNFGENFLTIEDVLSYVDVLNVSNAQHWRVTPQIRHAGDDEIYTEWRDYLPGLINARFFQVRLVLSTDDPLIVPFVSSFTWSVDVPDMIDRAENVVVPDTGMSVEYANAFHAVPNVQIAWLDAIDGDRYVLTNQSETGFEIQFFNGATAVSRVMNRLSQGY